MVERERERETGREREREIERVAEKEREREKEGERFSYLHCSPSVLFSQRFSVGQRPLCRVVSVCCHSQLMQGRDMLGPGLSQHIVQSLDHLAYFQGTRGRADLFARTCMVPPNEGRKMEE